MCEGVKTGKKACYLLGHSARELSGSCWPSPIMSVLAGLKLP